MPPIDAMQRRHESAVMRQPLPAHPVRRRMSVRRLLPWLAVMLVLLLVFVSYLRPGFALDLANRFILCL